MGIRFFVWSKMQQIIADYICLNAHLFQTVSDWLGTHALKIISMTQSSFPCHRAWLVSSGTNLAPSTSTSWPYAFCLLSQPFSVLLPLILTLALSHDPKSFPVRPWASPGPPSWLRVRISGQECCRHHDEWWHSCSQSTRHRTGRMKYSRSTAAEWARHH